MVSSSAFGQGLKLVKYKKLLNIVERTEELLYSEIEITANLPSLLSGHTRIYASP